VPVVSLRVTQSELEHLRALRAQHDYDSVSTLIRVAVGLPPVRVVDVTGDTDRGVVDSWEGVAKLVARMAERQDVANAYLRRLWDAVKPPYEPPMKPLAPDPEPYREGEFVQLVHRRSAVAQERRDAGLREKRQGDRRFVFAPEFSA
jgi:hypothetical protein